MYSDKTLQEIVEYLKEDIKHAPVHDISDIYVHPNPILLSYCLAEIELDRSQLAHALRNPPEMNRTLELCVPEPQATATRPSLDDGYSVDDPAPSIAAAIRGRTDKFAQGYDIHKSGQKKHTKVLVIGDRHMKTYVYPSGKAVDYYSVTNEMVANSPIFEGGSGILNPDEIYVRENFVTMMLALLDAMQDRPEISCHDIAEFPDYIKGIVIAHEKSEIELEHAGMRPGPGAGRELMAEFHSRGFLQEHGVDINHYFLFHKLRAGPDKRDREKRISKLIVY